MAIDYSGLDASQLLEGSGNGVRELPYDQVKPDPDQPRKTFNAEALKELAESIETHGIIQPLVVKADPNGGYTIVAGERRWRAAALAKLEVVPVIVRDDLDAFAQVVENIQRENLTSMELYRWIAGQLDVPDMTQTELAGRLGKSKTWVSFYASISKMPDVFQSALHDGLAPDVTALNQLFKLWKSEPALAEKLASSGTPITRQAVAALAEKIKARVLGSDGSNTAGGKGKPDQTASKGSANDDAKPGKPANSNDPRGAGGTSAEIAFAESQSGTASPTAALPLRILVRYDGEAFAVRYTSQRQGADGLEVMLENEGGMTLYAPLADLQLTAISQAQQSTLPQAG